MRAIHSQIQFLTLTIALLITLFFSLNLEAVTVKIDPSEQEIPQGSTATVNVFIENVTNLGAFEFKLNYDGTVVIIAEVGHVQLGPLDSTGRTVGEVGPNIDNTSGVVSYGAFSFGDNPGPDGSGALATITFTSQNIGISPLSLTDVKVTDIEGNIIAPISIINGQITVSELDKSSPTPNEILSISAISTTQLNVTSQVANDSTPPVFYSLDGEFFDGASWLDNGGGVSDYSYSTIRPNPFNDTNLLPNGLYRYRQRVKDSVDPPNESNWSAWSLKATLLNPPTAITFSGISETRMDVSVLTPPKPSGAGQTGAYFDIIIGEGQGSGANDRGWADDYIAEYTNLLPNTQYGWQVKYRNYDSVGTNFGSPASRYTLANVPSAPVVSNPTETTLDVDILPNGNPPDTLFALYNKTSDYYVDENGENNGNTPVWQTDSEWGTVTVVNLTPDTTYEFQVKATNGDGIDTVFGNPGSGKTLANLLPAPSLSGEARFKQVLLQWNTVPDASGYKVYRSTTKGSGYVDDDVGNTTSYEDNTVANGTTYYYSVSRWKRKWLFQ